MSEFEMMDEDGGKLYAASHYAAHTPSASFFNESDLANGSFGPEVEKYLGKSPVDGPPGYTFRKIVSIVTAPANKTKIAAVYKYDANNHAVVRANDDTVAVLGLAQNGSTPTNNTLLPGDYVLGAILQLTDGRSDDKRSGTITAGLAANDAAALATFANDIVDNPSSAISSVSVGGARTVSASTTRQLSVCTPNINIHMPPLVNNDAEVNYTSAPILAINITGFSADTTENCRGVLTQYALCGPRDSGVESVSAYDPEFKLSCLTAKVAKHPVSVI
jgi:hypothetical protein